MVNKKITELKETIDVNFQLIATELDTSVNDLRVISSSMMNDSLEIDAFNKFSNEIEENGVEITSFDDNTVLVEYLEEPIVVHTILGSKSLIFDAIISNKIEQKMNSYK